MMRYVHDNDESSGADAAAALRTLRSRFTTMSSAERTAAWWSGELPLFPVMRLFGVRPRRIVDGVCQVEQRLTPSLLRADGTLPAGLLAVVADVVTGGCITATMPVGEGAVTVTLTVEPTVDPLPTEGLLIAEAKVVTRRGPHILAEGELRDESGTQVARISAWYLATGRRPGIDLPDPPSLPPRPEPVDVGLGPIGRLLGVTSLTRADRSATATMPARPELMNLGLSLHGGAGGLFADLVCQAALGEGTAYYPLTSTYSYLRSTGVGGTEVQVRARVLKPGRTVATVEAEVLTPQGKPALHVVVNAAMRID